MDQPLYLKTLTTLTLYFSAFGIATHVCAQPIQVLNHTRIDLPVRIESTNMDAKSYAWQLELIPQPNRQVTVKLLNPNPQMRILDTRALNIARSIQLSQLPNIDMAAQKNTTTTNLQSTAKSNVYYGRYVLVIKFPRGYHYAIKPRFNVLQEQLQRFCDDKIREQKAPKLHLTDQQQLIVNSQLGVDSEGYIRSVQFSPALDQDTTNALRTQLQKARFHPYNQYGLPASFSAEQPLIIQCQ